LPSTPGGEDHRTIAEHAERIETTQARDAAKDIAHGSAGVLEKNPGLGAGNQVYHRRAMHQRPRGRYRGVRVEHRSGIHPMGSKGIVERRKNLTFNLYFRGL